MGDSSSASYIHMVHHLIEECIIFNMTREECMEALSKHAKIKPIITSTGTYNINLTLHTQVLESLSSNRNMFDCMGLIWVAQSGRSWRRRTRSSSRPTQTVEKLRENPKRRESKESRRCSRVIFQKQTQTKAAALQPNPTTSNLHVFDI
ncbi:PREDICTED: uncharacterized protein LOC101310911 isoform 1 [Fragaria vesca subsp. vesca]